MVGGFFSFMVEQGIETQPLTERLNIRYRRIIDPIRPEIEGARILDLGSHNGRWPYAYAEAGAAEVLGIEGRAESLAKFARFPEAPFKSRVKLICGDFIPEMDRLIAEGRTFDIISCLGVFYHTMQHYRMLLQFMALRPKLIILDSSFSPAKKPLMEIGLERIERDVASIAQAQGQAKVPVGYISIAALRVMAIKSLGLSMERVPWRLQPGEDQSLVSGYFPGQKVIRATFHLRPPH
jgi:SAM-dependent methyltransferase